MCSEIGKNKLIPTIRFHSEKQNFGNIFCREGYMGGGIWENQYNNENKAYKTIINKVYTL